jgi:hypothetical protein
MEKDVTCPSHLMEQLLQGHKPKFTPQADQHTKSTSRNIWLQQSEKFFKHSKVHCNIKKNEKFHVVDSFVDRTYFRRRRRARAAAAS